MKRARGPGYSFAPVYDDFQTGLPGDVEFYVEEARAARGKVLELACGTGRILIPIAEAGKEITGIDLSTGMLRVCRRKVAALAEPVKPRITLAHGDMRDFDLHRRFDLIICPFRAFLHNLTDQDQKATLRCVRRHLTRTGRFIMNHFDPWLDMLVDHGSADRAARGLMRTYFSSETGNRVDVYENRYYDLNAQLLVMVMEFHEQDDAGRVFKRVKRPLVLRYVFRYEMEHLFELCAWRSTVCTGTSGAGLSSMARSRSGWCAGPEGTDRCGTRTPEEGSMLADRFAMKPDPDFNRLLKVLRRQGEPDRVPYIELFADGEIVDTVLGLPPMDLMTPKGNRERSRRDLAFCHRLGYDYVWSGVDALLPGVRSQAPDPSKETRKRSWVTESQSLIRNWEDFEKYPWPRHQDIDFSVYDYLTKNMPEGMKALAATGGILEYPMWIMGYETLSYLLADDPALVRAVVDRCSEHLLKIYQTYVQFEVVGGCWISDDMGFKTQTMISPADMRTYIFPWQKRLAQVIHGAGRPVLLHSCGNLSQVMDDLIDDVGIDAKHSFEDVIQPVTEFKKEYGRRVAVLGGVDVDFLCRHDEVAIRKHVRRILETCAPGGGYALGTGNSVANFMPVEHYLTMLDEGWRYSH